MPNGFCSNCRTKYSLFNPENGCSSCAFSFCSKCISYKALLPRLADKPVSVCYACYQKLNDQKIKQPSVATSAQTISQTNSNANWWGEGLPPPSLRQTIGFNYSPKQIKPSKSTITPATEVEISQSIADFEKRLSSLKEKDNPSTILTVEEIENRLAALRGCDVEVIRNPRSWFDLSSSQTNGANPDELLRNTKARVAIDKQYDPDAILQRRYDDLRELDDSSVRMSTVSEITDYSDATKEELEQINKLMNDAEKCVHETNEKLKNDSDLKKELDTVMASVRQKSLDLENTNNRVQNEMSSFWNKQMSRQMAEDNSEEDEVDDETVKRIVAEAEATSNEPVAVLRETPSPSKKKNFFSKLFKK